MINSNVLLYSEAKNLIFKELESIHYHQFETINLFDAVNRFTAETVVAPMNIPSFNNSAMDGYVIRQEDLTHNKPLTIAGSLLAGDKKQLNWPQNSCLRIMTGAFVPDDAFAIIMQEQVKINNNTITFDASKIKKGQNIRYVGENIKIGAEIFPQGEKLTIPKLSTLASLGLNSIKVYKPIKVALFSTGDELTPVGQPLISPNNIYDSNCFSLHLMLNALGCEVINLGIIKDDLTLITSTLEHAAQIADLVITTGGVSVGDADYTKTALEQIGKINFWKIAMKPGKPFAFGKIKQALFCGLPGNPVSSFVTFYQLVRPIIFAFYGQKLDHEKNYFSVKSLSNLKKTVGRIDFQRGYLTSDENGDFVVASTGNQGSHITSSFHEANCFIVLEKDRGNISAGEMVTVEPFDSPLI